MDVIDVATDVIEAEREELVRARRAAVEGKGAVWCEDCGDQIPLARSRALPSARRCIDCQEIAEREGVA